MSQQERRARLFGDRDDRVRLERHRKRLYKHFPECEQLWAYVDKSMKARRTTWNRQHKAALYAATLNTLLRAMSILEGDDDPPPLVVTGWEHVLGDFNTGRCLSCERERDR